MTITALPTRNEYTANAGQTVFNYTFKIFDTTDLNVYVTPAGQNADDINDLVSGYTVAGVGDEDGGAITLSTPTSANDLVTIVSAIPDSRKTDYQNNGDFIPDVVNDDLDRVVSLVKQIGDLSNRAILFQESEQGPKPITMPGFEPSKYFQINSTGDGIELSDGTIDFSGEVAINIADLRTKEIATNAVYYLAGYSTIGDGGQGHFIWNPSNLSTEVTADTQSGIYVAPNSDLTGASGAWVRLYLTELGLNALWFGVANTGVDTSPEMAALDTYYSTITGGSIDSPDAHQIPLRFPSGVYDCSSSPVTFSLSNIGQQLLGDGQSTQLTSVLVSLDANTTKVSDVSLSGAGGFGVRFSGVNRYRKVSNVYIGGREKAVLYQDDGFFDTLSNVNADSNDYGFWNEGTMGCALVGCNFNNSKFNNYHILADGELKFTNCRGLSCGYNHPTPDAANDSYNMYIYGSAASNVVEHYFDGLTLGENRTKRALTVSLSSTDGGAATLVTFSEKHRLVNENVDIEIDDTTNYNGTYNPSQYTLLSGTTLKILTAYISDESGTFRTENWDLYIDADSLGDTNDLFFNGGNINKTAIMNGYNITFNGTRLKDAVWLEQGNVNRINIIGSARGRFRQTTGQTRFDVPVGGSDTGWSRIYFGQDVDTFSPGSGNITLDVPDSGGGLNSNNEPTRLNRVKITEDAVLLKSESILMQAGAFETRQRNTGEFEAPQFQSGQSGTLADDTAYSFTPSTPKGFIIISNGAGQNARIAQVVYDTVSPGMTDAGYVGSVMNVTTGVLSGTTGLDNRINISAANDGKIYIENRTGGNMSFYWTIFR